MNINIKEIKTIPIESFLQAQGFSIKKNTTHSLWFTSPFRNEKTPSFKVNLKLNTWYDFGEGQGGDIIKLAMLLWNENFKETIHKLSAKIFPKLEFVKKKIEHEFVVKKTVANVQNQALLSYLEQRGICPTKIDGLLGEIYYLSNDKHYFGLAFQNDKGGYEIRNKYFKGCTGNKYFSTIKKGYDSITVFEGFMDMLSMVCRERLKSDILVLNSCSNVVKILPVLREYKKVYLMLDNDAKGNETTTFLTTRTTTPTVDLRYLFKDFKDVNEWHCKVA